MHPMADKLDLQSQALFSRITKCELPLAVYRRRYIVSGHDFWSGERPWLRVRLDQNARYTLLVWDGHLKTIVGAIEETRPIRFAWVWKDRWLITCSRLLPRFWRLDNLNKDVARFAM